MSAKGQYRLDCTATFTATPDPFTLDSDGAQNALAGMIQLEGKTIFQASDSIQAGQVISITPLPDLKAGLNEFYFEFSPPMTDAHTARAVRLRFFRDEFELQDETYWAEPGEQLAGSFIVNIIEEENQDDREHDH